MNLRGYQDIRVIKSKGKYGRVFSALKGDSKFIIKEFIFARGGRIPFEKEKRVGQMEGIPPLVDVVELENKAFVVRKYIDSMNLEKLISKKFFFSAKAKYRFFLRIFVDLCKILTYVHKKGIIHNDIRPSNVLLSKEGSKVFLIDFATAKLPELSIIDSFSLIFSPPESVLRISELINPSTDIYLCGVSLWIALNGGRLPYKHHNPEILINAQLNLPLPKTMALNTEIYSIISKATYKKPFPKPPKYLKKEEIINHISSTQYQRFASAADFEKALEDFLLKY